MRSLILTAAGLCSLASTLLLPTSAQAAERPKARYWLQTDLIDIGMSRRSRTNTTTSTTQVDTFTADSLELRMATEGWSFWTVPLDRQVSVAKVLRSEVGESVLIMDLGLTLGIDSTIADDVNIWRADLGVLARFAFMFPSASAVELRLDPTYWTSSEEIGNADTDSRALVVPVELSFVKQLAKGGRDPHALDYVVTLGMAPGNRITNSGGSDVEVGLMDVTFVPVGLRARF